MPRDTFGKRKRKKRFNRDPSIFIDSNQIERTSTVKIRTYNNANKSDHRSFIATKSLSAWQNKLLDDDNVESRWLENDGKIIKDIRKDFDMSILLRFYLIR